MNKDEKYYFSFVPRNACLVEELDEVMTTYTDIMKMCKQEGFSIETVARCKAVLNQRLLDGNERMRQLHKFIMCYLDTESALLTAEHSNHKERSMR